MQIAFIAAILLYMLSSAAYFAYLFIQRDRLQQIGGLLLMVGFACHTVSIGWAFADTGHVPVNNLHETLSMTAWAVVGAFLVLNLKFRIKILGVYVAPLVVFILLIATQFPREPLQPQNMLKGIWLLVHIITIFAGDAAFALAAGVGGLYLLQERNIKAKTRGFFFKRLPSLDLLDTTGYACIVCGFTLLTIGLISGMVYAKILWGRFWSWDPKEVWSAITWIFYAVHLHVRLAIGWRGRRAAVMAIVGLGVLLFTFLGVNFLLSGHHGQFTQY
ncbi:c-type cytochrome biogenesis protein CcsB [Desulfatitalea tepidiphila]|uniref:c-type cytochrome biogenesis protein CcsB n=1 Tax=Desulfatitalea tepidiphila TaxID=1185843 RepID=UPI0006B50000|nr:c-type cytochrome biogenesis protein CcsB [Desulfatitalea tepidiphila]